MVLYFKIQVTFCLLALPIPVILTCWSEDSYRLCQSPRHTVFLQQSSTTVTVNISSNSSYFKTSIDPRVRFDNKPVQLNKPIVTEDYSYSVVYGSCSINDQPDETSCKQIKMTVWGEKFPFKTVTFHLYQRHGSDISYLRPLPSLTLNLSSPEDATRSIIYTTQPSTNEPTDPVTKDTTNDANRRNQGTTSFLPYPAEIVLCVLAGVSTIAFIGTLIILAATCRSQSSSKKRKLPQEETGDTQEVQ